VVKFGPFSGKLPGALLGSGNFGWVKPKRVFPPTFGPFFPNPGEKKFFLKKFKVPKPLFGKGKVPNSLESFKEPGVPPGKTPRVPQPGVPNPRSWDPKFPKSQMERFLGTL